MFEFSATYSVILKVDNLPSMKKWFMLNVSCNYWDAGAGTVGQTAVSQDDQILAMSVTSCGSIV